MSKPKKILIIQQSPAWGGAEEWMSHLIKQMINHRIGVWGVVDLPELQRKWKRLGAQITPLSVHLDFSGDWKGLIKSLVNLPKATWFYFWLLKRAQSQGYTRILMSGFSEKMLVSHLASMLNMKMYWYEYGPMQTTFRHNWGIPKIIYKFSKHIPLRIITISRNTKLSLINDAQIDPNKINVIYPGTIIPQIRPKQLSLTVGCLSRVAPEKGQRLLIAAWYQVHQQFPQSQLLIAGSGKKEMLFLTKLVHQLNLQGSVKLIGFVQDKSKFYQQLDLFVFPSVWSMEGFGIALIEAMSYGLTSIAFAVGPQIEVITAQSGVLIPRDLQVLSGAIIKLLKQPSILRQRGKEARRRVKDNFDVAQQTAKVIDLIFQN